MREILFRGKRLDNGEWACGDLVQEEHYFIWSIDSNQIFGMREDAVIPETVGQYTGLTDRNGRKIFEGDIIEMNSGKKYIGIVEYWEDSFRVVNHKIKYYDFASMAADGFGEVIGNIHDNPELLRGD